MDDRYDPNLILGYVEDELIAADRARVDAMLAEDESLASLVADLQRDRAALRSTAALEPKADLAAGAIAALERQMLFDDNAAPPPRNGATPSRFRLGPLLTYGGIAAVLALTVTVVFQSLQSDGPSPMGPLAMEDPTHRATQGPGVNLAEAPIEAQRRAAARSESSLPTAPTPSDFAKLRGIDSARQSVATKDEHAEAKSQPLAAADAERSAGRAEDDERPRAAAGLAAAELESPAASVAVVPPPLASEPLPRTYFDSTTEAAVIPPASPAPTAGVAEAPAAQPVTLAESAGLAFAADDLGPMGGGGDNAFSDATRNDADTRAAQSTVADLIDTPRLSAPRYTLNVFTPSAEQSRQQLDAWAVSNHIAVHEHIRADAASNNTGDLRKSNAGVLPDAAPDPSTETDALRDDGVRKEKAAPPVRQQVVLRVAEQQVEELVQAIAADRGAQIQLVDTSNVTIELSPKRLGRNVHEADVQLEPMFASWWNWHAVPNPVVVEVVIEESTGPTPTGPLRHDAVK